jgi:hypothetical protein
VFSFLKPRFDAGMAGVREARVVPGAPPARPLSAYAGEYEHRGYGILSIALNDDTLKSSLGTMDMNLSHRHYETFDLEWGELGDQPMVSPLMFLTASDGNVSALTVQFEPLVESLRFDRLPDMPGAGILRRLCGTYAMGSIKVTVACAAIACSPSPCPAARPAT